MLSKYQKIMAGALVAVVLTAGGVAFAVTQNSDTQSCGGATVAEARATHNGNHLTIKNPPPGSVAGGGGQRVEVNGHSATLKGPGKLEVDCR